MDFELPFEYVAPRNETPSSSLARIMYAFRIRHVVHIKFCICIGALNSCACHFLIFRARCVTAIEMPSAQKLMPFLPFLPLSTSHTFSICLMVVLSYLCFFLLLLLLHFITGILTFEFSKLIA
jgi:hypothetical protein